MENAKEAKKHLKKIRKIMSRVKSPYEGMNKQESIDEIRKTREKLWEKKLAAHS